MTMAVGPELSLQSIPAVLGHSQRLPLEPLHYCLLMGGYNEQRGKGFC